MLGLLATLLFYLVGALVTAFTFLPVTIPAGFGLYYLYRRTWQMVGWSSWDPLWSLVPYLSVAWLLFCRFAPSHMWLVGASLGMALAIPLPTVVLGMRGRILSRAQRTIALAAPSLVCTYGLVELAALVRRICL